MYQINYSVVVPVYRGELTLRRLSEELIYFFKTRNLSFEIIFVDDFAPDKSWDIIKSLKNDHLKVIRGIKFSRNFGQHNALLCGILNATGEYIITIDEDLQQSPSDIIRLIDKQKESDYDLVYGRFPKLNHNKFRNLTSVTLRKLLKIGLPELHPDYSAFRLIKSEVAKKALSYTSSYVFIDAYFPFIKYKTASVEVNHLKRHTGRSSYNIMKLINHSINIFVHHSVLSIRILTWSLLILISLFFCYGIFLTIGYVFLNLTGKLSVFNIGLTFLLLTVFIIGTLFLASLIVSILRTKKSGLIVKEVI